MGGVSGWGAPVSANRIAGAVVTATPPRHVLAIVAENPSPIVRVLQDSALLLLRKFYFKFREGNYLTYEECGAERPARG